ncbi:MAG: PAS domain S-box protein [Proteobacteria bacterium]|nr:PAS domain S-box protein [Pseudomonadota bacterium]MBU1450909.1 PAS domain S-box protein [Pseudomonadota bacterium]MBU2468728.1 PAS domain S-box protein [Pseudomonadota bacterium]MBU2518346.1 PAS domain S-box protein [Pseudomonadota bacterium]
MNDKANQVKRAGPPAQAVGPMDLAQSEARFRLTFEQAPVGIIHGDLAGRIRLANRRISELFGYEPEDPSFLDLRLWECTHPDDYWTVERFKKLLTGEIEDYTVEKRYFRQDGELWWASVRCCLARDGQGQPQHFIVIVEDISQRKMAEEGLKKAHEDLEAKVAERTAELKAANTALKVMLNHRAEEKMELEAKVTASAAQLVMPFVERLLASGLGSDQRALAEAVRAGVSEITSPFARRLSSKLVGLTPKELEVARLVKEGKGSSEIAQVLAISENAVAFHRQNIRAKLGLKNKGINLCSYLRQMS